MKPFTVLRHLVVLLGLLAAAAPACAQKYDLKLDLKPGEKSRMMVKSDQTVMQEMGGKKIPVEQHMEMGLDTEVLAAEAGFFTVKMTYTRLAMSANSPQGKMSFDSDKDTSATANPMAGMMRAMVGAELTLRVTDRAKVVEMKGYDKVYDKMFATLDKIPAQYKAQVQESMKDQFGEKTMMETINGITDYLPETPIAIGESWTRKEEVASGVPVHIDATYTLKAKEGDVYMIEGKSTVSAPPNAKPVEVNGMTTTYAIAGTQTGTARFRTDRLLSETNVHQEVTGSMIVKGMGQDMSMPISVVSDVHVAEQN